MKPTDLYIQALGTYLPPDRISREEALDGGLAPDEFRNSDLVAVPDAAGAAAVDLALAAARQAVHRSGREAAALDLLVHSPMFWQGPEGWAPAGFLLRELGCANIAAHEVRQGCNGALAAIELAAGWLSVTGPEATALVTTAINTDSPGVDRWHSGGFGIALGDGAAAAVLGGGGGLARIDSIDSVTYSELERLHRGSIPLTPDGASRSVRVDVAARIQDFTAGLDHDPFYLHRLFTTMYADIVERALGSVELKPADLARVVFTNVGADLIKADLTNPLGLELEQTTWDHGRTIGHIGPCDHLVSLDHLLATGQLAEDDKVLVVGGSQGYNVAALLLTVTAEGAAWRGGEVRS